jgi:hypothetical protein
MHLTGKLLWSQSKQIDPHIQHYQRQSHDRLIYAYPMRSLYGYARYTWVCLFCWDTRLRMQRVWRGMYDLPNLPCHITTHRRVHSNGQYFQRCARRNHHCHRHRCRYPNHGS